MRYYPQPQAKVGYLSTRSAWPPHITYKTMVRGTDMDVDRQSDTAAIKSSKSRLVRRGRKTGRKRASAALLFPVYKQAKRLGGNGGQKQRR